MRDFRIVIDTREQAPYAFACPSVRRKLVAGDYSVDGLEQLVAVERKSLADFTKTVLHDFPRFAAELDRLANMPHTCIVVEADLDRVLRGQAGDVLRGACPDSVLGAAVHIQTRFAVPVRNVSDFKTVTSYRLIGKDQYEEVAPGGELKHGTLGEQSYSNKADTYGLLLSIDRRDIINDDLGAITTVPRKLGRGSGLKINDIFWKTFLANSGFFKAANSNYLDGAESALSIEGLSKAEETFLNQTDPDGKPLGAMPALVLVPTALSATGTVLYKSLEIRDTSASTKYPVANPHTNKFRVEVSRYLSNSQYPGHSSKAWYLLADPSDLAVIEVAFLNGQESPTIETAEADFNVLGIQMRGYHDFGVALQEPRGGVKNKGEA